MFAYIEDLLHLYVDTIGVEDTNSNILTSISRQCKKGIAMTDRQYELVKSKLQEKTELLQEHVSCNIEECFAPRIPLRQIDRSKTISFTTTSEVMSNSPYEQYKENWVWVKIRFPFSKKLISKLEKVKTGISQKYYFHKKGSHEHYFKLHKDILVHIVNTFSSSNFDISKDVIEYYNITSNIKNNASALMINYKDGMFNNLPTEVISQLENKSELIKLERHVRYGYAIPDMTANTLLESIACRTQRFFNADPEEFSLEQIADALELLERFPLLVLIDENESYQQLEKIHSTFSKVSNNQQSVLFREESDSKNNLVNEYVKNYELNNWVDNTTKIVYIKKKQLPKVMFTSGFVPITALSLTSLRSNTNVESYVRFNCDLILFHDKEESLFSKFGQRYKYGYM